jgi:hypothetical protein
MVKKPMTKRDTPEAEYQRFREMADKIEASDDPADFDRAFERVTRKSPKPETKKQA